MSENTTIELEPTQCAIVLDEDWDMQIYLSNEIGDEDDTPMSLRYMTMLAILTKDEEFVEDILDRFQKVADVIMEEEKEN